MTVCGSQTHSHVLVVANDRSPVEQQPDRGGMSLICRGCKRRSSLDSDVCAVGQQQFDNIIPAFHSSVDELRTMISVDVATCVYELLRDANMTSDCCPSQRSAVIAPRVSTSIQQMRYDRLMSVECGPQERFAIVAIRIDASE